MKITTKNSIYILDTFNKKYKRVAHGKRTDWELQHQRESEHLDDEQWYDYDSFAFMTYMGELCLNIRYPGSVVGIITSRVLEEDEFTS